MVICISIYNNSEIWHCAPWVHCACQIWSWLANRMCTGSPHIIFCQNWVFQGFSPFRGSGLQCFNAVGWAARRVSGL